MIIKKIKLLNTIIHKLTMDETLYVITNSIEKNKQIHHVVVNASNNFRFNARNLFRHFVNSIDTWIVTNNHRYTGMQNWLSNRAAFYQTML